MSRVIDLWCRVLPEHPVDRRAFVKNVLLDMNFEPEGFLVAEEDGKLRGFAWAIVRKYPIDVGAPCEEDKAYLNVLAIEREADINGGLGAELVKAAEEYIYSHGNKKIMVSGYSPNYFYPGVNTRYKEYIKLYEGLGYTEQKRNYSIGIDLLNFSYNVELEALRAKREEEGFIFTELKGEYIPSLLASTLPSWRHRHRRLLNETMDYRKFRLIVKDGEVIGSAVFGDPYSSDERFGPYGINEKYRGLGLGKILLYDTLMAMKRYGLRHAWAQSTPTGGAAFGIYEKFGFVKTDEFITYAK